MRGDEVESWMPTITAVFEEQSPAGRDEQEQGEHFPSSKQMLVVRQMRRKPGAVARV